MTERKAATPRSNPEVRRRWISSVLAHRQVAFVALVWTGMVAAALACVVLYGRDIPLAEDWLLVAPYTGHEADLTGWLWAQNNEHRVPLPRLIYLALLAVSGGDFRAGMVYNVLVLAVTSALLMHAARRVRGGRSCYTDSFFPLVLLHLGHWPNLVWGWQLQFVTSVALTLGLLLVLLRRRPLTAPAALGAGACLVLLPLCGANGLIYVVALAPWFAYEGLALSRSAEAPQARRAGRWLVAAAVVAVGFIGVYFLGYQRATWNPPPPSARAVLTTSAAYVAMGVGPAARTAWSAAILGTAALLLPTGVLLIRAVLRRRGLDRQRALGLTFFAAGCAALALAVGWGRSGLVPEVGLPARYALLSAPTLVVAYFIWTLYSRRLRHGIALLLLVTAAVLVPFNTRIGFGWRNWYVGGMEAVERDVAAGVDAAVLAERHRAFLLHWDQEKLEDGLRMLQDARLGPYRDLPPPVEPALRPNSP